MDDTDPESGALETEEVEVRSLAPSDIDWMVRIDKEHSGRARRGYYEVKLAESQRDTNVRVSLAAIVDETPAGFLMGRVYYGEFGLPDRVAILDGIAVSPDFSGRHVGETLLRHLRLHLRALGVEHIQTQVEWDQQHLIGFLQRMGFQLAPRLSLELRISGD